MGKEVYGYLYTHWDREWYKTFEEFRIRLCDVLDDIFQKIEKGTINSFYLDGQVIALDDYLEIYPEKTEYVKGLIKSKKLFIGPFYDLADEFLVNGESLSRNLLIGTKKAKEYGADEEDFIGYLPDAFGHCGFMPMLFKKSKINNAIVWRGVKSNSQEFLWSSPDGSEIKTVYLPAGYFMDFLHKKSYKNNLTKLLNTLKTYTNQNTPILLPIGGDHLNCASNIKAKIKNFNRNNNDFHLKLSSLSEYYKKTQKNIPITKIKGELRNNENSYILMGTASSRIDLKQLNMNAQWELGKVIEPLYSLFSDILPNKKAIIDYAWKTLIKNHAHDSICGCSIDDVHRENITRYNKVLQITNALKNGAISKLSEKISQNEIGIINTSNFDFSGVYTFYSDKKLNLPCVGKKKMFPIEISQDLNQAPVQEHYKTYYEYLAQGDIGPCMIAVNTPKTISYANCNINNNHISNSHISISVNNDGTINIRDNFNRKELQNIFKIIDEADVGDSYNFDCIIDNKPLYARYKGSKIIEKNNLRNILRLFYEIKIPSHAINLKKRSNKLIKHTFEVDLILTAFSGRIDIKINYENLSKDHILKLNFSLPDKITKVKSEDTFGVTERIFNKDYDYKKTLPQKKYKEANINTGIFQRFVMVQGLCAITKGLQEYEVNGNNLNITLLRSFGTISKKTLLTRTAAAGPPLPTPDGQMLGRQTAEISLLLTDNETDAFKEADFFYNPFVIITGKSEAKSQLSSPSGFLIFSDELYIHSIKKAENKNGIIVKIYNYTDKTTFMYIHRESYETNLLEEKISYENLKGHKITFKPNELKIFNIL